MGSAWSASDVLTGLRGEEAQAEAALRSVQEDEGLLAESLQQGALRLILQKLRGQAPLAQVEQLVLAVLRAALESEKTSVAQKNNLLEALVTPEATNCLTGVVSYSSDATTRRNAVYLLSKGTSGEADDIIRSSDSWSENSQTRRSIQVLINMLSEESSSCRLQSINVIYDLALHLSSMREVAIKAGAVKQLITLLSDSDVALSDRSSAILQLLALDATEDARWHLCDFVSSWSSLFMDAAMNGGIILYLVSNLWEGNAEVKLWSVQGLRQICRKLSNTDRLSNIAESSILALVSLLEYGSFDAKNECILTLLMFSKLLKESIFDTAVQDTNFIRELILYMSKHSYNKHAVALLSSLLGGSNVKTLRKISEDGVMIVVDVLSNGPRVAKGRITKCLHILLTMSDSEIFLNEIAKKHVLIASLSTDNNEMTKACSAECLGDICHQSAARSETVFKNGAILPLVALLSGEHKGKSAYALCNLAISLSPKPTIYEQCMIEFYNAEAVPLLITLLSTGSEEAKVNGMSILNCLACSEQCDTIAIAVPTILIVIRSDDTNDNLFNIGLKTVFNLASRSTSSRKTIVNYGGISALMSLISCRSLCVDSVEFKVVVEILCCICRDSKMVIETCALPSLLEILSNPVLTPVKLKITQTLSTLAKYSDYSKDIVVNFGSLPSLICLLKFVEEVNIELTMYCAEAIGDLLKGCSLHWRGRIATQAFPVFSSLLRNGNAQTKAHVARSISNLCKGSTPLIRAAVTAGFVQLLVELLSINESLVSCNCADALGSLCVGLNLGREAVLDIDCSVSQVVRLMCTNDVTSIIHSLRILGNVAAGSNKHRMKLVTEGCIALFVNLLRHQEYPTTVKRKSTEALGNIAFGCDDFRGTIVHSGALPLLISQLTDGSFDVRFASAGTLCNLAAGSAKYCSDIVNAGAIPALKSLQLQESVQEKTLSKRALNNLNLVEMTDLDSKVTYAMLTML